MCVCEFLYPHSTHLEHTTDSGLHGDKMQCQLKCLIRRFATILPRFACDCECLQLEAADQAENQPEHIRVLFQGGVEAGRCNCQAQIWRGWCLKNDLHA